MCNFSRDVPCDRENLFVYYIAYILKKESKELVSISDQGRMGWINSYIVLIGSYYFKTDYPNSKFKCFSYSRANHTHTLVLIGNGIQMICLVLYIIATSKKH